MQDNKKEFFRLWYEYLKESDDYKKYCEWMRKRREISHTKEEPLAPADRFLPPYPEGLEQCENFVYFQGVFVQWDDIHAFSFEECYKAKKEFFQEDMLITDYYPILENYIDNYIRIYKEKHPDKEPSLREFKDWFFDPQFMINPWDVYLKVNAACGSTTKLIEEFRQVINKKKEEPIVKQLKKILNPSMRELKERRRYLEVFKLRGQGLGWDDVLQRLDPKREIHKEQDEADLKRAWHKDLQEAKKIIASTERGYFPKIPAGTSFLHHKILEAIIRDFPSTLF